MPGRPKADSAWSIVYLGGKINPATRASAKAPSSDLPTTDEVDPPRSRVDLPIGVCQIDCIRCLKTCSTRDRIAPDLAFKSVYSVG